MYNLILFFKTSCAQHTITVLYGCPFSPTLSDFSYGKAQKESDLCTECPPK